MSIWLLIKFFTLSFSCLSMSNLYFLTRFFSFFLLPRCSSTKRESMFLEQTLLVIFLFCTSVFSKCPLYLKCCFSQNQVNLVFFCIKFHTVINLIKISVLSLFILSASFILAASNRLIRWTSLNSGQSTVWWRSVRIRGMRSTTRYVWFTIRFG